MRRHLLGGRRHRLLDDDVAARFERLHDMRVVVGVAGADDKGVGPLGGQKIVELGVEARRAGQDLAGAFSRSAFWSQSATISTASPQV